MVRMALDNGVSWSFKQSLLMKRLVFHQNVSQFPFHSENRTQICWTQRWCYENHVLEILKKLGLGILTWTRGLNHDHEGGSSRARLLHCTKEWLTPAISPNVGNSASSFLLVGICVRANPFNLSVPCTTEGVRHVYLHLSSTCTATQGGAVSQFLCLFSPFWVDEKQRIQFSRFCFGKTPAKTPFKELPMTISVPVVLEALFLWLQAFVLLGLMSFTRQAFVFTGCLTQTQ